MDGFPQQTPAGKAGSQRRFLLLALAAGILLLGAIRNGQLPGYDDARYATVAKNIARSGQWLYPVIRGEPDREHPPLLAWMQAASLRIFGISDSSAKLPSALCALGAVLLVYWLARRMLGDSLVAEAAMFIMLATPYFLKYANRAMTDVPVTFFFLCAVAAWWRARESASWCIAAGLFTSAALMTRGLIGFALPVAFAMDYWFAGRVTAGQSRKGPSRRAPLPYLGAAAFLAVAPLALWYVHAWTSFPKFAEMHGSWLQEFAFGAPDPPWRRYTGLPEYVWMLAKSYWPWLPAMGAGVVLVVRKRRRDLYLLLFWAGVVFMFCGFARSRVLRYMLPAYPAFSILAAIAIANWVPRRIVERTLSWAAPLAVGAAFAIVLLKPPSHHAAEILPLARAASNPAGQVVAFYDQGQPRWDEANQLEWYGDCVPILLRRPVELAQVVRDRSPSALILDRAAYERFVRGYPHTLIHDGGRLVYVKFP